MRKSYIYILFIAMMCILHSCAPDETLEPGSDSIDKGKIEFVARPTNYKYNNLTKVTSAEIQNIEDKIHNVFFLLFDNDGNRVVFSDLTTNLSETTAGESVSYTIPDQTIISDKGLSKAVACFLANVPTAYAKSLTTVADLKGAKPLSLTYASIATGCIGIPILKDESKNIEVNSIPMAGILEFDLSNLAGNGDKILIPLERLFAKIVVNMSVNIEGYSTKKPQFTLSNFIVNNMPSKLAIMKPENDSTIMAEFDETIGNYDENFLSRDNVLSYFNLDDGTDDNNVLTSKFENPTAETKSLFFYTPEHMVPRDIENEQSEEEREKFKPTLITNPNKKPIYITILGDGIDANGNEIVAKYNIYLGENEYDDFNIKRNSIYTNNILINGTDAENRVVIKQGDISVSFKRATYLDSHFEVRPLRVTWVKTDDNGIPSPAEGTVTVKILDAYDDNAAIPNWVRLERPSNRAGSAYCGTIGKRKYFTTDLVTTTLANSGKEISYQINTDKEGDYPTWVYVDEYLETVDPGTLREPIFTDAVRQAKIRVLFTPKGESSPSRTIDYIITQRSVYPVVATNQKIPIINEPYTYGIEYFEEYLYDYDSKYIQDSDGGFNYDVTQDGMEWGLDGVQLSHLNRAVNMSELTLSNQSLQDVLNRLPTLMETIKAVVNNTLNDEALPYYDFYLSADNPGSGVTTYEYNGIQFNKNILGTLKGLDAGNDSIKLALQLNETPISVIEYCYNKNKRNSDGTITTIHWYAPAIDEIEDITLSAYDEFDVFQNKLYWSCQPAFYYNSVKIPSNGYRLIYKLLGRSIDAYMSGSGNYQFDNTHRARATKIDNNGKNIASDNGTAGYYEEMEMRGETTINWRLQVTMGDITTSTKTNVIDEKKLAPGNRPRVGVKHRVRCVYDIEGIQL